MKSKVEEASIHIDLILIRFQAAIYGVITWRKKKKEKFISKIIWSVHN